MFIFGNRRSAYLQTRMMSSLDKSFTNSWSQLIARAERVDQFCTAAATYTGRRCNAISYEGVEAGYEVCADRIDILCLSREDLLERDAGKEVPRYPGVFECDFGHGQMEPVRPDGMIDIGRGGRWMCVVIGLREVQFPLLNYVERRQVRAGVI